MTNHRFIPLLLVPLALGSCGEPPHEEARRLMELGDLSRAERLLSEALDRSPDDVLTRELLVQVHERRSNDDLALESARVLVNVRGYPADHFLLARIAAQTGDFPLASRVLEPWSDEEMEALVRGAFEAAGRGLPDDHWIPPMPDPEEYRILRDLGVGDYLAASAFIRSVGDTNWTWVRVSREVMDPLWSALWLSPDLRDRFADSFLAHLEHGGDLPPFLAGNAARDLAHFRDLSDLQGHREMRGRLLAYLGDGDQALQEFQRLETAVTVDEPPDPGFVVRATGHRVRLLQSLDRTDEASRICRQLAADYPESYDRRPPLACASYDAAEARPPPNVRAEAPPERIFPEWFQVDHDNQTVDIHMVAGATSQNNYWNFQGYYGGRGGITVPEGYTVTLTLENRDPNMGHSAGIAELQERWPGSFARPITPVFQGAVTRNPTSMIQSTMPGERETITFVADRAGEFALICYVVGHASAGRWMPFTVSAGGEAGVTP